MTTAPIAGRVSSAAGRLCRSVGDGLSGGGRASIRLEAGADETETRQAVTRSTSCAIRRLDGRPRFRRHLVDRGKRVRATVVGIPDATNGNVAENEPPAISSPSVARSSRA